MYTMQIIIVGAGSVGFNIAERLASENKKVVLIDNNYERLEHVREVLDVQTIHGAAPSQTHFCGEDHPSRLDRVCE